MYKSYSYSNMPMPVNKKKDASVPKQSQDKGDTKRDEMQEGDTKPCKSCDKNNGLLDNLESDDIILLVVAFVLLMDDCDDKLLLGVLAYIFFSGNC